MAYCPKNKLLFYKKVVDLVNKHFIPDITTYAGIWRRYIKPAYPMSYRTFMKIMAMPVDRMLKELEEEENTNVEPK